LDFSYHATSDEWEIEHGAILEGGASNDNNSPNLHPNPAPTKTRASKFDTQRSMHEFEASMKTVIFKNKDLYLRILRYEVICSAIHLHVASDHVCSLFNGRFLPSC